MTPHGSCSTYVNHRCSCEECRAAWRVYNANRRAQRAAALRLYPNVAEHGSRSTYKNWGCRCGACVDAMRADGRERYWRRKAQAS